MRWCLLQGTVLVTPAQAGRAFERSHHYQQHNWINTIPGKQQQASAAQLNTMCMGAHLRRKRAILGTKRVWVGGENVARCRHRTEASLHASR